jgi:hypothetical protein
MSSLRRLAAKQKADAAHAAEQAARRKATRIARKFAREQEHANGPDDLPLEVAVAIELNSAQPVEPEAEPASTADDSVPRLVSRLTAIREKIWRLQAMFAVSLSPDCLLDANKYLSLFQSIAEQLKAKDASALDAITCGHESLLLSPPIVLKQTIPLATQRLVEIRWEAMTQPMQRAPKRDVAAIPDGLGWML